MELREHIYSVLLVSASEKINSALLPLLPEQDYQPVSIAASVGEAERRLQARTYDLVIINAPLPDDLGRRLAVDVCLTQTSAVLLLLRGDIYDENYAKVMDYGVFTLRKPTSAPQVLLGLDWLRSSRERLRRLESKSLSLEEKMAEIRIVNHAKWALIECCQMTEADAHKYIEKQAMDRCVTRREIAEGILQTYK